MKLTDFITDIGRPVAYYPGLKKVTGSTTATILLCQFIYWRGKEADKTGWLYKTSDEIEEETGLTYNEQKTARKTLIDAGLMDEHYARLDHQLKFKVNLDAINEKWASLQPNIPESDDVTMGNDDIPQSLYETETTTETTNGVPPTFGYDWQIAGNVEKITETNEEQAKRVDVAGLIATGTGGSAERVRAIAYAFQDARNITFTESQVKGQRKAARELANQKVTAEHIRQAVRELLDNKMTVTDLYSVTKTAINIANPAPTSEAMNPLGLEIGT